MTTDTSRPAPGAPAAAPPKVNRLALVSIALVVVATLGSLIGGGAVMYVFAVGPAHVALHQIKARGERGAILAYITLGISYLFATYALVATLYLGIPYLLNQ